MQQKLGQKKQLDMAKKPLGRGGKRRGSEKEIQRGSNVWARQIAE